MTTKQKKEWVDARRAAHHRALETLRAQSCEKSGLQLWRKLRELERLTHAGATAYCNGKSITIRWPILGLSEHNFRTNPDAAWEHLVSRSRDCVRNILGQVPHGFFVNGDARGYALKLDPDATTIPAGMHTDWGRNGILAAEIGE